MDGLLVLIGGIVLLTPGLLTDLVGFALMVPGICAILRERVKAQVFASQIGNFKCTCPAELNEIPLATSSSEKRRDVIDAVICRAGPSAGPFLTANGR